MKLDLTPLEKALAQLEQSLSCLRSELAAGDSGLRAQFRAAAIQGLERTYVQGGCFGRRLGGGRRLCPGRHR